MKIKINIKSIIFMTLISIASLLFINISFAANMGKIITETARLREQPQTDAKVLELASIGEEVEILEEIDEWYKVKYKNITGYIRKDLVELENKDKNTTNSTQISKNEIPENETVETNTTSSIEEKNIEKGKYKLSQNIKLKIIPLITGIELDEVAKDVEVEVTEILNDWVKIKTQDGKEGWIRADKLQPIQENSENNNTTQQTTEQQQPVEDTQSKPETTETTKTMYVNSQTVNVRQKADKTSQVIKQLTLNTKVTVLSSENGWAYIKINETKGYIAENLLSSTKQETSRSATTERNTTNTTTTQETNTEKTTSATDNKTSGTGTGSTVVAYAKQFLGSKYVYGGTSTSGFDCSGFTQYVYKHFGINLNRTAASQYSNGTKVTDLQAGDLVMFGKSGINHVGIYIGGNTFIHAANASRGVTTDTLASGYYKTNYVGARRIF